MRCEGHETVGSPMSSSGAPTVVVVRGEVDTYTSPRLRSQLLRDAQTSQGDLVIDLTGTSFLDCSGLAAIAAARGVLRARNRDLRVRGARGVVARVIALTDVAPLLAEGSERATGGRA